MDSDDDVGDELSLQAELLANEIKQQLSSATIRATDRRVQYSDSEFESDLDFSDDDEFVDMANEIDATSLRKQIEAALVELRKAQKRMKTEYDLDGNPLDALDGDASSRADRYKHEVHRQYPHLHPHSAPIKHQTNQQPLSQQEPQLVAIEVPIAILLDAHGKSSEVKDLDKFKQERRKKKDDWESLMDRNAKDRQRLLEQIEKNEKQRSEAKSKPATSSAKKSSTSAATGQSKQQQQTKQPGETSKTAPPSKKKR